ncbi:riboflavin synthase subunit alpha [Marinobacter sp. F3R08]|uniref:riboflavin synthase subunit alpha n=1 Tax=Marinobacter sp. F3R08 TaxID=2841559 RepID=UPI001C0A4366|nr:riboflavin synthase subunit alpha [Marinobacter sp. F3R08]MBU2955299.1 riboflavin synthase subunit alpha [Marinobacter sp. F3R08]
MFTGIVQGIATIEDVSVAPGLSTFAIRLPADKAGDVAIGASVAINGTCLTVTRQEESVLYFDAMQETLSLTTLGELKAGDKVNFERAARIGDEIGGHLLSGHIHTSARIVDILRPENNVTLWFETPDEWKRYIFPKGYIAINGASLTIGEVQGNRFNIHLIPETLRATTFGTCKEGQRVNIEVDSQTQIIVDTLARLGYDQKAPTR